MARVPLLLLSQWEVLHLRRHRARRVWRSRRGKVWVDEVGMAFGGGDGAPLFFSGVIFFDVLGR